MSDFLNKLEEGFKKAGEIAIIGVPLVTGLAESKTIPQPEISTNEPSYSQVQKTEAKSDPLAEKPKKTVEPPPGYPSNEMQQLGDSQDKSNEEKRNQIYQDITADNQPTISGSPPELTSCPVPSEDKYAQLQEPITSSVCLAEPPQDKYAQFKEPITLSGVTNPELRVNTPIPDLNFPKPDLASLIQKPETHSYNIPIDNADLANQLRSETSSPSSQNEPQEVTDDSGNI